MWLASPNRMMEPSPYFLTISCRARSKTAFFASSRFGSEAFSGVVVFFLVAMVTPVDSSFPLNIAQLFDASRVAQVKRYDVLPDKNVYPWHDP